MAKPNMSSGLQQMKFMQRALMRSEAAKQSEENELDGDSPQWVMPVKSDAVSRNNCVVITEGDPKPGALFGRMSFQQFNPSVDKLFEEAEGHHKRRIVAISEETGKSGGGSVVAELLHRKQNGLGPYEDPTQTARSGDSLEDKSIKKPKVGTNPINSFGAFGANYKQQEKEVLAPDVRFKKPSDQHFVKGRSNWKHLSQSTR